MSRFVDTLLAHCAPESPVRSDRGSILGEPTQPYRLTWTEVHEQARRAAGTMMGLEAVADTVPAVHPGNAVAVLAGDPASIAPAVHGVWLAGGSVTMLHGPTPRSDLAGWAADTVTVLGMVGAKLVLLGPPFDGLAGLLDEQEIGYQMLCDLTDPAAKPLVTPVPVEEDDTALLQLTSGSTAVLKAVRSTHGNLFANMTAMARTAGLDPAAGGTVTAAPNFGYGLLAWRLAGAEADTLAADALEALEAQRRAVPAGASDRHVRTFPRLGPPLPDCRSGWPPRTAARVVAVRIDAGARRESVAVVVESSRAGDVAAERILRREVTCPNHPPRVSGFHVRCVGLSCSVCPALLPGQWNWF